MKIGPAAEVELLAGAIEHRHPDDVRRQQVAGELHALPRQPQHVRERMRERRLADPRHVLDEQMAARQQAREAQADLPRLAEDHGLERRQHARERRGIPVAAAAVSFMSSSPRTRSSCAGRLADGAFELGAPARARRHHLRRRVAHEVVVGEAAARLREILPGLARAALPSRSASAAASMSPAIGTSTVQLAHQRRRGLRRARAGGEQREVVDARQPLELAAVAHEPRLVLGARVLEQHADAPGRADVHLTADLAHRRARAPGPSRSRARPPRRRGSRRGCG